LTKGAHFPTVHYSTKCQHFIFQEAIASFPSDKVCTPVVFEVFREGNQKSKRCGDKV